MRWLLPLDAPADRIGGKAAGLGRARAAGVRVPDGFAIDAAAYDAVVRAAGGPWEIDANDPLPALERAEQAILSAPLPDGLEDELAQAAASGSFAVRSSATVEDQLAASAAGAFESKTAVEPAQLVDAVRAVWASAWGPGAWAYLHARGASPATLHMAVLVHPFVAGQQGTVFSRDPSAADSPDARVEISAPWEPTSVRVPREAPDREPAHADAVRAALTLEQAAGRALDVEWVRALGDGTLTIVQQRPITAFAPPAFPAAPPDGAPWKLDAEHNPEPLSPAQEGLVARVANAPGLRQCVLAGYLYGTREGAPKPPRMFAPADLLRAFDEELAPAMEAILAPLESAAQPLETALDAYVRCYEIYATAGASLARARAALAHLVRMNDLDPRLAQVLVAGTPTETTARDQALWEGKSLDRWAALAPIWDVASATWGENPPARPPHDGASPDQRRAAAAKRADELLHELLRTLPRMARGAIKHLLPAARAAHALGERDDLYFARAQRLVRCALLARGPAPAIFFLPLGAAFDPEPAARAQAEHEQRRRLVPPPRFWAGRPDYGPPPAAGAILRGLGTGGRARGRVGDGPGEIRVVPTLLPQTSSTLVGAAGVVTDHGGLLSHGATQAREYGVPAVLGVRTATAVLKPGDRVLVDADRGMVYRL